MNEIHALSRHANAGPSGNQNDFISSPLNQNIQRRSPHSYRGDRGTDLVGFLIRMSGYEAKGTLRQLDGDITGFGVIKHRSIKLQSGARPKRQVGVIAKHKSCIAVGRRPHDFIANDLISFRNPRDLRLELGNRIPNRRRDPNGPLGRACHFWQPGDAGGQRERE
jgi:hypothetical protein